MYEWFPQGVACASAVIYLNRLCNRLPISLIPNWLPASWEGHVGLWWRKLHGMIVTQNKTVAVHLDEIARKLLIRENNTGNLAAQSEGLVLVERGYSIEGDWMIPTQCVIVDECLLDSIAQTMQRNDIVHTTIMVDIEVCSCDLSTVTLTDVHAALLGRHLIHLTRHHFGAVVTLKLITFLTMCIAIEFLPFEMMTMQVYLARDLVRHIAETFFQQQLVFEADEGSMRLAHRAGYNPLGMLWLLEYYARRCSTMYQYWRYIFPGSTWFAYSKPFISQRQAALLPLVELICLAPDGQQPIRRVPQL